MRLRITIGAAGILLGLFGVYRLLTQVPSSDLLMLVIWLLGALVVHDGLLAPVIAGLGALLAKVVPDRARRFLQGGLVSGAAVAVIALPMIYRAHSQPKAKAILDQNFGGNLAVLLTIVAGGSILLYVVRVLRDRPSAANDRPSDDQTSSTA